MLLRSGVKHKLRNVLTAEMLEAVEMALIQEELLNAATAELGPLPERVARAVQRIEGLSYGFAKFSEWLGRDDDTDE